MRSMWKGAISFGLVNIPVKLYTATEKKDVKFNYLHSVCKTPVQYQKVCPVCQREVPMEEIVRGYEYQKGKYVLIAEEDLENLPAATARAVEILDFIDLAEIDPLYYDKSYYLTPNEGGQKAYALLKKAMQDTGKIAIAKVVIRSKQSLAAIRVHQEALVMETMFFPEEIRSTKFLAELDYQTELHDNELKMAISLINSLAATFDPEKYNNEYRAALMEVIQAKIAGEEISIPAQAPTGKVIDLMEALKASIQLAKTEKTAQKRKDTGTEGQTGLDGQGNTQNVKSTKATKARAKPTRKTS